MNSEIAALLKQLTEAGISQATVQILQAQGLNDAETLCETTQSELTQVGIILGDAKKLKRLFPTSNQETRSPEIELAVDLKAPAPQPATPNPYLHLLDGEGSSTGVNLAVLNPNIKPDFIKMAAKATCAYVLLSGDILEIFSAAFWRDLGLEDLELRGAIDDWLHQKDSQQSITKQAVANLTNGVESLYSASFDQMVQTLTRLSAQKQLLRTMGVQAQLNIGSEAGDVIKLTQLVPLAAEELTGKMLMSRLPEQAGRLIKVISALMALLKDPRLHASAGVIAQSADESAVKFLQKRLAPTFVNRFRLALSYEKLVSALAQCPSPTLMTMDYLEVLGQLGSELEIYFGLVTQAEAGEAKPFARISSLNVVIKESLPSKNLKGATQTMLLDSYKVKHHLTGMLRKELREIIKGILGERDRVKVFIEQAMGTEHIHKIDWSGSLDNVLFKLVGYIDQNSMLVVFLRELAMESPDNSALASFIEYITKAGYVTPREGVRSYVEADWIRQCSIDRFKTGSDLRQKLLDILIECMPEGTDIERLLLNSFRHEHTKSIINEIYGCGDAKATLTMVIDRFASMNFLQAFTTCAAANYPDNQDLKELLSWMSQPAKPLPSAQKSPAIGKDCKPQVLKMNKRLSAEKVENLVSLLLSSFRSGDDLEMFVFFKLDFNLSHVTSDGSLKTKVFELVSLCENDERTCDLLNGLLDERPNRTDIREFVIELATTGYLNLR